MPSSSENTILLVGLIPKEVESFLMEMAKNVAAVIDKCENTARDGLNAAIGTADEFVKEAAVGLFDAAGLGSLAPGVTLTAVYALGALCKLCKTAPVATVQPCPTDLHSLDQQQFHFARSPMKHLAGLKNLMGQMSDEAKNRMLVSLHAHLQPLRTLHLCRWPLCAQ